MTDPNQVAASFLSVFLVMVGSAAAQPGVSPSFDCARAAAPDERQICKDDRLAELDQAVNIAFGQVLKAAAEPGESKKQHQESVKEIAKENLADRRACGNAVICILDAQVSAIAYFAQYGSSVPVPPWIGEYRQLYAKQHPEVMEPKLPKTLGHCTRTKIVSLTDRGGEPLKAPQPEDGFGSGTTVTYANDASQVSYRYEERAARSHIGDEVLLCLSSIPRDCPPGDDRGRVYSGTNLKTGGSWMLPDSQHSCGGA